MKIYRVRADVERYQHFIVEDPAALAGNLLVFDGTPKLEEWKPPAVRLAGPMLKRGCFLGIKGVEGTLVADSAGYMAAGEFLEMAGELLPLPCRSEMFHVLNITECINALDQKLTEWNIEGGVKRSIRRYAFHGRRMSASSLFKIPETAETEILTYERLGNSEEEFKAAVQERNLEGVTFEELWNDGK